MKVPHRFYYKGVEYIPKNTVDDMLATAKEKLTDVFIEKACVKLKKLMYDSLMFQGRLHRREVIDNFVKDFKEYMKEE